MSIHKTAGSRFFIGPVIDPDEIGELSDEAAVAYFEAIPDGSWIEVEEIEDLGEHGDTAEAVTFTSISNRRVRKLKGSKDAGTKTVVVGRDPLDDGQVALVEAEATDFDYAFKVEHADARGPSYTDSVDYFGGMVMSKTVNQGQVNTVTRRTHNIGINTAVYEVASEKVSS